jgi:hypothetical protein
MEKKAARYLKAAGVVALAIALALGCGSRMKSAEAVDGSVPTAAPEDSGIHGSIVSAWGNPPANPPTSQCVKVFDATGKILVANVTCSGLYGEFRASLRPGTYVVEAGGSWDNSNGTVRFKPNRQTVEIRKGQWVEIGAGGRGQVP